MADYDYIIVGAGSAGGALAARLSENPANKILLLEAGAASHPYSRMPLSFGLLIDNPAANWLLPVRARAGHGQPPDPSPARQTFGWLELDQRPGLGARPAARLRHLGADGLPRLELARRGAALHPDREFRRRRRQQRPWHRQARSRSRPCPTRIRSMTRCSRPPGRRLQAQPRLQQRGPGRRRQDADLDLQGPAHERRPLLHRAGDEALAQPPRRHQRHDAARAARRQALRRRRVREGRQGRAGPGDARRSCRRAASPVRRSSSCPASASPNCCRSTASR